jgi:hypothetical protein
LALAWIVDLLLVFPVCFTCWFCWRRRHGSTVDSSRCSDDAEEIQRAGKAGKDTDGDAARSMLQLMPSPSRRRRPSGVSATDKLVEDETTPRSQEASMSRGEPEPESSLEQAGPDGTMGPFEEAEPEQKAVVIRRNSCDLVEVMRQRREVCNTWESDPDCSTADTGATETEVGGVTPTATPTASGAASTSAFHVTTSPKLRLESSDLAEVMRQRRQVCQEFNSESPDSAADTTGLLQEAAVPGPVPTEGTLSN